MKRHLPNVTLIGIEGREKYLKIFKTAADVCQKDFMFGSVKLLSSIRDTDPRIVHIEPVDSTLEFSEFCIKNIWKYVDTEFALFFQHDGFILNPSAWTDDFLNYDYIGAVWYHLGPARVGNGGFSLRSRKLLKYISENYEKIGGNLHPEDVWICDIARPFLEKEGMKIAPVELGNRFSKEGDLKGVCWNGEFGFHGGGWTDISKWLNENPEYKKDFQYELSDFAILMKKYQVYDGTFHVLQCKPIQVEHYKKLAFKEKNYDCRIDFDLKYLPEIKIGHKIIYKLFRISVKKVGVGAFERRIKKIENFKSKKDLLEKHPEIKITPSFNIPKWKQHLVRFFDNIIFPNETSYTLFLFE